jgi:hypothetical protein
VTQEIPISRVTFNGAPYAITPLSCTVNQSVGQHEQVELRMFPVRGMSLATGAYKTMSFTWDTNSSGRFFGYITDYSVGPRSSGNGTVVTITAMGPTFVMKTGRPRFFTNASTATVISRIAAEAQLGFVDEYGKDHYVWPQLAQTDESDWEFANDLASREGSQLLCMDGVLRLVDPTNVLSRTDPTLLLSNTQADTVVPTTGLLQIDATSYSSRLPSSYSPSVAFLNNRAVELVPGTAGSATYQQRFSGQQPLRNQDEALLAQTRLPVDWDQKATIRVAGSARLMPGSVVAVKGGNKMVALEPYDGYWYITDVQHTLARLTFQSKVELARVVTGSRRLGLPAKNWWLDQRGRPTLVLNNIGNWVSTWR